MSHKMNKAVSILNDVGYYFASNREQKQTADELVRLGTFRTIPKDWGFSKTEGFYVSASVVNKNHMPISMKPYCDGLNELKLHEFVQLSLFQNGPAGGTTNILAQICNISQPRNGKIRYEVAILGTNEVICVDRESLKRTFLA